MQAEKSSSPTKHKRPLLIDIDGTSSTTMGLWLQLYNFRHSKRHRLSDLKNWNSWECIGATESEFWEIFDFMEKSGLYDIAPMMSTQIPRYISELSEYYDVSFCTARSVNGALSAKRWMKYHHIPDIPVRRVGRDGMSNKLKIFENAILFDDSPLLIPLMKDHPDELLCLHLSPWNREFADKLPENVIPTTNWHDFRNLMIDMAGEPM